MGKHCREERGEEVAVGFALAGTSTSTSSLKMKVTVCFGNVRVIVPCPNPEMLVRDLILQATLRYKKATGKGTESWVAVHKLKSQSDGGILDPDDKLVDVADDREQIMAIYEEDNDGMPSLQHNAGDGTSASSVGTNSPDIFQGTDHKFQPFTRTDIEITGEELSNGHVHGSASPNSSGVTLQVRRGSEPALNRMSPVHLSPPDPSKRWSAAPIIDEDVTSDECHKVKESKSKRSEKFQCNGDIPNSSQQSVNSSDRENSVIFNKRGHYNSPTSPVTILPQTQSASNSGSTVSPSTNIMMSNNSNFVQYRNCDSNGLHVPSRFSRDTNRLSMQINVDGGAKWVDAADRALSLSLRKEPVGADDSVNDSQQSHLINNNNYNQPQSQQSQKVVMREEHNNFYVVNNNNYKAQEQTVEITLRYEGGPLGVHLVPDHMSGTKNQGLIVQGIDAGRIDRDGRVRTGDKIISINGHSLLGVPFQQAQELFREELEAPELRLKIIKNVPTQLSIPSSNHVQQLVSKFNYEADEKENMVQSHEKIVGEAKTATVSPTKKMPLQSGPLARPSTTILIASNTRKIGRKYDIDLQKGSQGLGFSITTRDNPAGGNCPIYIKNILPTGAAIDDGRLRPGDRLLEVNGIEITGKSQSDAVSILRNVPQGGIVKLVVSRQERVDLSPKLPRQLPPDKLSDDIPAVPWSEREVLALEIPVLDTEKAGLGISVKGKTTAAQRGNMIDMGIYIKSVIHGGAASRDGRLKPNDQLMSINGVSLLDICNTDAMETLRRTMTQDNGPKPRPGFITLTIGRRVPSSSAPTTDISGCGSSASGDEMDSWSARNDSMSADGIRHEDLKNGRTSKTPENGIGFVPAYNPSNRNTLGPGQTQIHNRSSSLRRGNETRQVYSQSPTPYGRSSLDLPRNPVLDRLTGKSNNQAMRNESYYRATHETWNTASSQSMAAGRAPNGGREPSAMVPNGKSEMILYESDYSPPEKPPRRSRSSTPEDHVKSQGRMSSAAIEPPVNVVSPKVELPAPSDITYASQTSLEEGTGGFARDAFGRQSMSEKRHATLDAKSTDTYQRNKKLKEERERQKLMQDQEDEIKNRRSEQLARERNLQDELARRGTKRPFSSSTEDELQHRVLLPQSSHSPSQYSECYQSNFETQNCIIGIGKRGLGDQLKELLQQWGHKQSGFLQCGACSSSSTHRSDAVGLPRTNSADSLVEALKLKQQSSPRHQPQQTQHVSEINFRGSKRDIGPSLGMKKSSSLESLQTMVQEIQIQEDLKAGFGPARAGPAAVRVIRGRGCNESFRQAVDRSYDAPLGELGMETLAEEETESCISGGTFGRSQKQPYPEATEDVEGIYGKKGPGPKKKQGIFRGLGSMFRFGRHRKSSHGNSALSATEIRKQQAEMERMEKEDNEMAQRDRARQVALAEQMRIQEQYRRLVEKQKQDEVQGRNPAYGITVSISNKPGANYGFPNQNAVSQSQLQPQHQFRKSMDPQSIREKERENASNRVDSRDVNGNSVPSNHARAASYDVYNEMTRPGSRVGFVDPKKYSHYINYEEIRHHLNDKEPTDQAKLSEGQLRQMRNTVVEQRKKAILESRRHQQHYHSQRRESPRERQERPVSNFYEYESVKAAMHAQGFGLSHPHQPIYGMNTNAGTTNNGVTLPSPTTLPHSHNTKMLHQLSPSQFQAVPPVNHSRQPMNSQGHNHISNSSSSTLQYNQQKPQQQMKPNSLPRFNQKEMLQAVPQPMSSTNHRHVQQMQQQQISGRYTMPHSHSNSGQLFRSPNGPAHSASSRLTHYHNHPNTVLRNPSTTTLGSKV